MKKTILLILIFIGISSVTYSQVGKESSGKSENFFSRMFHRANKPRAQMRHFEKPPKDPNLQHNGTSYWRTRKQKYKVDGNGFGSSTQNGGKKRGKKSGVK